MDSLNCKRDTTCKWKKKKNCKALHIDYTPFLGWSESFMTNLENKIKKKIKPSLKKKKKIEPYRL